MSASRSIPSTKSARISGIPPPGGAAESIPSRNSAAASSFSTTRNLTPALTVVYLLNNLAPEDLHKDLVARVDAGSPNASPTKSLSRPMMAELLNVLEELGYDSSAGGQAVLDSSVEHCVRCHSSFLERDNHLKACIVPHSSPIPGVAGGRSRCCASRTDMCVVSRHTTNSGSVSYNAVNIFRCGEPGAADCPLGAAGGRGPQDSLGHSVKEKLMKKEYTTSELMLVLSWTLKNITPEALHASLLQALGPQSPLSKTLSSGALPGLLLIFKRVGCNVGRAEIAVSQQTLKHCVRCHKKYMERNNGRLACQIPHKVSSIPCCDQNSSMCSVDRHTTVASNVAYNGVSLVACGVGALKCLKPTDG